MLTLNFSETLEVVVQDILKKVRRNHSKTPAKKYSFY